MYKNLREYTDFLVGIGKRYCCNEDYPETVRLTSIQQEIMTGFMIRDDLVASAKMRIPAIELPDIMLEFSECLIGDNNERFIRFISERAVYYYYNHCTIYLETIWSEKQCEMK